ncbi:YhcN/YlaJ family sporulation lipoprotein [Heliobacterium chlorum]|uniref:YhcN/YlaJ family sporulation lipoprotein n=1 Tax=Heliobacterium chlorum TaxID=2698 RepID=A0ABR7T3I4_HELCL|nr:YhcN/YlaJ family sporulation lipoprotein [Heliobacterium chlorum]
MRTSEHLKTVRIRSCLSLFILVMAVTAGCVPQQQRLLTPPSISNQKPMLYPAVAAEVKEAVKTVDGVEDSTAVVIDKDISTALKVTGFDRLRLKTIRGSIEKKLKESYPGYEVHVTTDKKMFKQLQQIEKQEGGSPKEVPPEIIENYKKILKEMAVP